MPRIFMKTEQLIHILERDLKPTKTVLLYKQGITFLFGVAALLATLVYYKTNYFQQVVNPPNKIEVILLVFLVILSSWFAVRLSIPGEKYIVKIVLLVGLFVLWTSSLLYRLFTEGLVYLNPYNYHSCIHDIVAFSFPPMLLLFWVLKKNYPVNISSNFIFMLLASFALSALAVEFMCPDKSPIHLFRAHYSTVVISMLLLLPAKRLLA